MRLLCLSLALAIIYIMAIMHSSRVEARATTPDSSPDSSSSSSESWEIPPKPPKPPTSAELDEDAALAVPTVDAIVYWTGQAFKTQQNNSMKMIKNLEKYPEREEAVKEYLNKTFTW